MIEQLVAQDARDMAERTDLACPILLFGDALKTEQIKTRLKELRHKNVFSFRTPEEIERLIGGLNYVRRVIVVYTGRKPYEDKTTHDRALQKVKERQLPFVSFPQTSFYEFYLNHLAPALQDLKRQPQQ